MPHSAQTIAKRIAIRRARPSDKKIVLGFCRRTWGEWGDYIDKVWDEWVKDKKGFFAVASLEGKPIGTAKLTVLNKREMWFEGLRVDPSLRGMGISHLLTAFLAKEALKRGAETVRYATGARNRASLHIGKGWGLRIVGRYSILSATSDGRRSNVFERISDPGATDEITRVVDSAPFTKAMAGLASEGWTFFQVDRDFLHDSFRKRELFTGTPLGILIASPQRKKRRLLVKLVAELRKDSLGPLLSGTRRLAYELDLPRVRLIVPATRAILARAREAGFKEEDKGFYHVVMEMHLGDTRTGARVARLIDRYL